MVLRTTTRSARLTLWTPKTSLSVKINHHRVLPDQSAHTCLQGMLWSPSAQFCHQGTIPDLSAQNGTHGALKGLSAQFYLVTSGAPRPTYPNQPLGRGCSRANQPPMCSGQFSQGDALGSICPILSPGGQFWAHLPKLVNRWHSVAYLPNSDTSAHSQFRRLSTQIGHQGYSQTFLPKSVTRGHYGAILPNSATREPS